MNGIAFCGKIGSGKSTLARALKLQLSNIKKDSFYFPVIYSFSTGVKKCAKDYFNDTTKNRNLLVNIGMKMRDINEDIWVDYLHNTMQEDSLRCQQFKMRHIPIIDDLRFINEYDYLKKNDFITIKINVPEKTRINRLKYLYPNNWENHLSYSNHLSETLDLNFDFEIDSSKSIEQNVDLIKKYINL